MSPELGNIVNSLIAEAADRRQGFEPATILAVQQSVLSVLCQAGLDKVELASEETASVIEKGRERNSVAIIRAVLFEAEGEERYSNLVIARKVFPEEKDYRLTSNRVARAKNRFAVVVSEVARESGGQPGETKLASAMRVLLDRQKFTGTIGDDWGELYRQINEAFPDLRVKDFIDLFIRKTR